MSTPEQPDTPALTRKKMREIRNTGATPIVSGDTSSTDTSPSVAPTAAVEGPEAPSAVE